MSPSISGFNLGILPGLSNNALQGFLILLSIGIFLWGFERYRTNFSRTEFFVSILLSVGILTVGIFPDIFGVIGSALNLERRSLVVSLLANTMFIFLILYLGALIRRNQLSISELTRNLAIDRVSMDEDPNRSGIYIVIPAYNEADTVQDVIEDLPHSIHGYDVQPLVISDGSNDPTSDVAKATGAIVAEHPLNQGQGGALKTGFDIALKKNADIVVTMDADGQHPAVQLPDLVAPIIDDKADYVVGSRYVGLDKSDNSLSRRAGIRAFTFLINLMTKANVSDCTNGFRAIRGSSLKDLRLTEDRFSAPELIIEARKNNLRILEVPVTIQSRQSGKSKKPKLGYAFGLARTIFVTWFR